MTVNVVVGVCSGTFCWWLIVIVVDYLELGGELLHGELLLGCYGGSPCLLIPLI